MSVVPCHNNNVKHITVHCWEITAFVLTRSQVSRAHLSWIDSCRRGSQPDICDHTMGYLGSGGLGLTQPDSSRLLLPAQTSPVLPRWQESERGSGNGHTSCFSRGSLRGPAGQNQSPRGEVPQLEVWVGGRCHQGS